MNATLSPVAVWTPHVTVAAVVTRQIAGQTHFLMVREQTSKGIRINQPAGHWERDETLLDAVCREVLEESGFVFTPTALLGVYVSNRCDKDITYLRFSFIGVVADEPATTELDEGILGYEWLSHDAIMAQVEIHRNPIVAQCLQDYLAGKRLALDLVADLRVLHNGA